MSWHPEGIWQCVGCGQTYPEYVNGCVKHDDGERKVGLAIAAAAVRARETGETDE